MKVDVAVCSVVNTLGLHFTFSKKVKNQKVPKSVVKVLLNAFLRYSNVLQHEHLVNLILRLPKKKSR